MKPNSYETALNGVADLFSPEHLNHKVRKAFENLEKRLNSLLFVGEGSDVAVDREAFLELVRDEELVPPKQRDVVILESAKHLGRRLRTVPKSGRRIHWREGEKYGVVDKSGVAELRKHGLGPEMSVEDIRAGLKEWYPSLPSQLLEKDSNKFYPKLLETLGRNRSMDCVASNLGWFAAFQVIGSIFILIILLAAGVAGWMIAAALLAFAGTLTVYVLLSCAFNTNFQQF